MNLKVCQQCKMEFECLSRDIENCFCNRIQLSAENIQKLQSRFTDCLCQACLEEIAQKDY